MPRWVTDWPGNRSGSLFGMLSLFSMLIVESQEGVEGVDEIVGTDGVGPVFAGADDRRLSYESEEAMEAAIQQVLGACQRYEAPSGIIAGVDDIAERMEQGSQLLNVSGSAGLGGREGHGGAVEARAMSS